jgi:polysaccharide pyruvyl transferase WcaK-like protein
MKNVRIFGEFDSQNVGDQLIGEGGKLAFEACGLEAETFSLNPPRGRAREKASSSARLTMVRHANRNLRARSRAYRRIADFAMLALHYRGFSNYVRPLISGADLVAVGGGQLIAHQTVHITAKIWLLIRQARRLNKAVMLVGVGVGEPRSLFARLVFGRLFAAMGAFPVLVRDEESAQVASRFRQPGGMQARVLPDNAIVAIAQFKRQAGLSAGRKMVGIAPLARSAIPARLLNNEVNSDQWWEKIVAELLSRGLRPALFCSGSEQDHERCRELHRSLGRRGLQVELLPRPQSSHEFLNQLLGLEHILCQRLHISISFLALGGSPTSISWDQKIESFYKAQGLGHRVVSEPSASVASICDLMTRSEAGLPDTEGLAKIVTRGISEAVEQCRLVQLASK